MVYYLFVFHLHSQHQLVTPHEESKVNFIVLQNVEIPTIHILPATQSISDLQWAHITNPQV